MGSAIVLTESSVVDKVLCGISSRDHIVARIKFMVKDDPVVTDMN